MNTVPAMLVLSSAQINFLNLILKEHHYMGKAITADGKTVKLFAFQPSSLTDQDYSSYLSIDEYNQLCTMTAQAVFSPYYRLLIRSLKDLVQTKNLTLNFKRKFYDSFPAVLGDFSHLSVQEYKQALIDLNNGFQDFHCKVCGSILQMTSCDSYFEYYACIEKPVCNYNIRVN